MLRSFPLSCRRVHRGLHSFPTRRSSDLPERDRLALLDGQLLARLGELLLRLVAHLGLEDRKSTRLNSSHSQISYAVFCLKKKKQLLFIISARYFPSANQEPSFTSAPHNA